MSSSAKLAVEAISSFQRDDMGAKARRSREVASTRTSRGSSISAAKPKRQRRPDPLGPTPERLAKADAPVRSESGHYFVESDLDRLRKLYRKGDASLVEPIIDRMQARGSLDFDPGMNDRMAAAGHRYEELAYLAGLSGIAAQNLLSLGGQSDPAHSIPTSEAAARARLKIREAWKILGTRTGAAIHGLLVDGRSGEDVGREMSTYKSEKECRTAGITILRVGLMILVNARWA